MPVGSIVDTHVHLWDPGILRYPWLDQNALLNRAYLWQDFRVATGALPIEAMVFVQCEAEFSAFEDEVTWMEGQAKHETRLQALVAWAPLERGAEVRTDLERLSRHKLLRGIRRIIQFEPDLEFCLRAGFVEGVRTLAELGLSFDICIDHRHLKNTRRLAESAPDVLMILDHIGKPDIRGGVLHPWAEEMRALARLPNVVCKISGVATEANHQSWTPDDLKPYIDVAIDAFGFDRIMFGGDWPVSTQAIRYPQWIDLLDDLLRGVDEADVRKFWRENARRVYRLG